jgi:hypothetical protein
MASDALIVLTIYLLKSLLNIGIAWTETRLNNDLAIL